MTKISDTSALTGASVDVANDLVPVVDMSEAGAARNKKMTFAEFLIGLGATTVGSALLKLVNPSAIRFLRVNADNTVTALDAAAFRTAIGAGAAGGASTTQPDEQISGFIANPADKSYILAIKMAHGGTITETTTKSASGTCTATFKINSTALGGTANSVSSSETSQAHASNNVFSAGDDIVLTVSSNSSCADLSFTIKYTRTLA